VKGVLSSNFGAGLSLVTPPVWSAWKGNYPICTTLVLQGSRSLRHALCLAWAVVQGGSAP